MQIKENFVLGETSQVIDFDTRLENRELATEIAGQAKQTLRIMSYDLENAIYDDGPFIQKITRLVKNSRYSKIQILARNSSQAIKHGHRLIECARKFSSYIYLHNPSTEDDDVINAFLVADEIGYLYKQNASRYEGVANFNDALRARELNGVFDAAWEKSMPDPEMRRLYI